MGYAKHVSMLNGPGEVKKGTFSVGGDVFAKAAVRKTREKKKAENKGKKTPCEFFLFCTCNDKTVDCK